MSAKSKKVREEEAEVEEVTAMDLSEQLVTCRNKLEFIIDCFIQLNPKNDFILSLDGINGLTYIIRDIEKEITAVSEKLVMAVKE